MRRFPAFAQWLVPVVVACAAAGCDGIEDPMVPEAATSVEASLERGRGAARGRQGLQVLHYLDGQEASDAPVTEWIGRPGGWLSVGRQAFLRVPRNAVRTPTDFSMSLLPADHGIGVELSATSRRGETNDVGTVGFPRPLTLCLYYENSDLAEFGFTPADLSIAWRVDAQDQRPTSSFL
ncbi:MAG: hypothetical protein ACRELV_09735, partial [Longimicrobiales bacterium]